MTNLLMLFVYQNDAYSIPLICAAVNKEIAKKSSEIADFRGFLVRVAGLEPTVSWSQTKRDTKLR